MTTLGAFKLKLMPTFNAELCPFFILRLTLRAFHFFLSQQQEGGYEIIPPAFASLNKRGLVKEREKGFRQIGNLPEPHIGTFRNLFLIIPSRRLEVISLGQSEIGRI